MNSYLAPKMSSFCVTNLRNSQLLRAIRALNLNILDHNLLRPELIRGSLMLLESAPLIGLMLPGIFIAMSLGALTASGVLPFEQTWLFASLGAMLGDSLGYWSGRLGTKELHNHLHKTRFLQKRSKVSSYLTRYGAPGIAVGRFVWFVHPVVPLLAGISGIPARRFYFYDLPACLLWVGLYLGVGHGFTGIWL